jgi:hypothetical protein
MNDMPHRRRLHDLRSWNDKEWWFSYVFDHRSMLYFSWTFFRAVYGHYFALFAFDARNHRRWSMQKICRIDMSRERSDALRLSNSGRFFSVLFETGEHGRLQLEARECRADLVLLPSTVPPFSKREDQFHYHYDLLHRYKHAVTGSITLDGIDYAIDTNRSYRDHCIGNIPRRAGWHWIALQNEAIALTSLVNYGPYAQRYSQVYEGKEWVRLDQNVSFEPDWNNPSEWRITSTDLDLTLKIHGEIRKTTRIPPLLPFLARVNHMEAFAEAAGQIRIDGSWRAVRELAGVLEEHYGWW